MRSALTGIVAALALLAGPAQAQYGPPGYGPPPGYYNGPPQGWLRDRRPVRLNRGALRGAAAGAAAGALLGGIIGGRPGCGAAIGGLIGGLAGASKRRSHPTYYCR